MSVSQTKNPPGSGLIFLDRYRPYRFGGIREVQEAVGNQDNDEEEWHVG